MYWWIKYRNYWFTYNRIDDAYKEEYLQRMRQEFKRAMQLNQLREEDFTKAEWRTIKNMVAGVNGGIGWIASIPFAKMVSPYIPMKIKQMLLFLLRILMKGMRMLKMICKR